MVTAVTLALYGGHLLVPGWNILKGHIEFLWNTHTSPVTSKVTHSPAEVGEYSGGGGGDVFGKGVSRECVEGSKGCVCTHVGELERGECMWRDAECAV